jgi:hypothetical protein
MDPFLLLASSCYEVPRRSYLSQQKTNYISLRRWVEYCFQDVEHANLCRLVYLTRKLPYTMTAISSLTCAFKSTGLFHMFIYSWGFEFKAIQLTYRRSSQKTWWWSGNHVAQDIRGSLPFESGSGRSFFRKCICRSLVMNLFPGGVVFSNQKRSEPHFIR